MASLSPRSMHTEEQLRAWLPGPLQPLATLATNLWWSWQPEAAKLFRSVDPERWERSGHNPVKLLRDAGPVLLNRVAGIQELVSQAEDLARRLETELARPFDAIGAISAERPVTFLCAECWQETSSSRPPMADSRWLRWGSSIGGDSSTRGWIARAGSTSGGAPRIRR